MVPVLMKYMGMDRKRVRKSILIGSLSIFFIYILFEVIALGILPIETIMHCLKIDIDAAQGLRIFLGSNLIGYTAQVLAFFAILTSFLAQA